MANPVTTNSSTITVIGGSTSSERSSANCYGIIKVTRYSANPTTYKFSAAMHYSVTTNSRSYTLNWSAKTSGGTSLGSGSVTAPAAGASGTTTFSSGINLTASQAITFTFRWGALDAYTVTVAASSISLPGDIAWVISYNKGAGTSGSTVSTTVTNSLTATLAANGFKKSSSVTTLTHNFYQDSETLYTTATSTKTIPYNFSKWAEGSTSGTQYAAKATYTHATPASTATTITNVAMYAIWKTGTTTYSTINWPDDPVKTGYTFKGWNTSADGTGTTITSASKPTSALTVYAQWGTSFDDETITTEFKGTSQIANITPDKAAGTHTYTRTDSLYSSYFTFDASIPALVINPNVPVGSYNDITIVSDGSKTKKVTLVITTRDASTDPCLNITNYGKEATTPTVAIDYHDFTVTGGYVKQSDLTLSEGVFTAPTGTSYFEDTACTAALGTLTADETATSLSSSTVALIEGTDYTYSYNWKETEGELILAFTGDYTGSKTITFDSGFTITLNQNIGDGSLTTTIKKYRNYPALLTTPSGWTDTRPGHEDYYLSSWNTQSGGGGTSYPVDSYFIIDADTTLYARWIPDVKSFWKTSQFNAYNPNSTETIKWEQLGIVRVKVDSTWIMGYIRANTKITD